VTDESKLALEVLRFVLELRDRGHPQLEQTSARIDDLVRHVVGEGLNILRLEDETTSLELLGGVVAVRRLTQMTNRSRKLPEHLRPELEKTLSQKILERGRGRPARTIRRKEDDPT
jgi:hypothetical protein